MNTLNKNSCNSKYFLPSIIREQCYISKIKLFLPLLIMARLDQQLLEAGQSIAME